jgi:hypothetical protein
MVPVYTRESYKAHNTKYKVTDSYVKAGGTYS